jgi:peptidoglycan/LPS O-acetylase OafA/YrhL
MTISISNAVEQTWVFAIILLIALLCSIKKKEGSTLSISVTQELKGFAILAVIFAHVGYFLVDDHQFLFPLSIFAGVGVDLFLFLSGYGLTYSRLKKDESIGQFYKRKLNQLFMPFWIVLGVFLMLDYFILHITRSMQFILDASSGIFTSANIYTDLNSPFWYFTFILFFYLLFPLVFCKKYPWLTAIILYLVSWSVIKINPEVLSGVIGLYKIHLLAFPLGVGVAGFTSLKPKLLSTIFSPIKKTYIKYQTFINPVLLIALLYIIYYTGIHSGVGSTPHKQELISLITMTALILFFILKKFEFRLLGILGIYSYEIYLFHWPLMYRYDLLYAHLPAWLATLLYLVLFIGIARILKTVASEIKA